LEREVKEAKADVLRLSAEGLQLKETLAAFQQGTNEALEAMVANHQELIAGLKVRDNNIKGALARRDEKVMLLSSLLRMMEADIS
jgi:predicted amidohydrolase